MMKKWPLKVCAVQNSYPANIRFVEEGKEVMEDKAIASIAAAVNSDVDVICFQELFNSPYFCGLNGIEWQAFAENFQDSRLVRMFQNYANETSIVMVVPLLERENDDYYCSTVIIDSNGKVIGTYRKRNICEVEKEYFATGNNEYMIFPSSIGNIGIYMCYDRHFSEAAEAFSELNPDIVFVPCSTASKNSRKIWNNQISSQSKVIGCPIVYVNRVGADLRDSEVSFFGSSTVCDSNGNIVGQASSSAEETLIVDI